MSKYFTWVLTGDGPQRRELKIGQSNDTNVEVLDGVAEKERVILNPRTSFAEEIAELTTQLGAESTQQDAENAVIPEGGAPSGAAPSPGAGGPAANGPTAGDGGPEGQRGRRGGGDPAQMFAKLDADKDGKLTGDEIPEQMKGRLSDVDSDSDGAITKEEMGQAMKRRQGGGGGTPANGVGG